MLTEFGSTAVISNRLIKVNSSFSAYSYSLHKNDLSKFSI